MLDGRIEKKQILLVDNDALCRAIIKSDLEALGYDVKLAWNGIRAINWLEAHCCDLVITEVKMPKMNGFQLADYIRASGSSYSSVPILCISDSGDDMKHGARAAGANGWIRKPWCPSASVEILESLIGNMHPEQDSMRSDKTENTTGVPTFNRINSIGY